MHNERPTAPRRRTVAQQSTVMMVTARNRHDRKATERFRCFTYDELMQRDTVSLDIFWIKDDNLEDTDSLPPPKEIAADIVENLETERRWCSSRASRFRPRHARAPTTGTGYDGMVQSSDTFLPKHSHFLNLPSLPDFPHPPLTQTACGSQPIWLAAPKPLLPVASALV